MGSLETYSHVIPMPGLHLFIYLLIYFGCLVFLIFIIIPYSLFHDYSMIKKEIKEKKIDNNKRKTTTYHGVIDVHESSVTLTFKGS